MLPPQLASCDPRGCLYQDVVTLSHECCSSANACHEPEQPWVRGSPVIAACLLRVAARATTWPPPRRGNVRPLAPARFPDSLREFRGRAMFFSATLPAH